MKQSFLSNDRIYLRAVEPEDMDVMYEMENDPSMWDMNEYYHVINDANESIRKALELLEQPDFEGLLLKKR